MEPARGIAAAPTPGQAGSEREALLRVAAAAAGAHDLEDVLEVAAEEARAAIGAASLSVSRWERERGALRTLINVGELGPGEERYPADEIYQLREDPNAERLIARGPRLLQLRRLARRSTRSPPSACTRLGKESEVGVPILVEGEAWGEVYATTRPASRASAATTSRFLEAIAGQLAVAIGRAELFSRVSRLAYEDPLTGLANRRALEERLQRAVVRAGGPQRAPGRAALRRRRAEGDQRRAAATTPATARCSASPRRSWRPPPRARATSSAGSPATSSASCMEGGDARARPASWPARPSPRLDGTASGS